MRTVSRRELARLLAAGVPIARTLRDGVEAPQSSSYIGRLTGITKEETPREWRELLRSEQPRHLDDQGARRQL
jgi:hypothetical protein